MVTSSWVLTARKRDVGAADLRPATVCEFGTARQTQRHRASQLGSDLGQESG